MTVLDLVKSFHNDESGQGLVEYLLVVALVALAAIVGMGNAARYINNAFNAIGSRVQSSVGT